MYSNVCVFLFLLFATFHLEIALGLSLNVPSSLLKPHISSPTEDKEAVTKVGWSIFLNGLPRKSLLIGQASPKTQVDSVTTHLLHWSF